MYSDIPASPFRRYLFFLFFLLNHSSNYFVSILAFRELRSREESHPCRNPTQTPQRRPQRGRPQTLVEDTHLLQTSSHDPHTTPQNNSQTIPVTHPMSTRSANVGISQPSTKLRVGQRDSDDVDSTDANDDQSGVTFDPSTVDPNIFNHDNTAGEYQVEAVIRLLIVQTIQSVRNQMSLIIFFVFVFWPYKKSILTCCWAFVPFFFGNSSRQVFYSKHLYPACTRFIDRYRMDRPQNICTRRVRDG